MVAGTVLLALVLSAAPETLEFERDDLKVYSQKVQDADVKAVRSEGVLDASPEVVRDVLMDEDFTAHAPHVVEYRVVKRQDASHQTNYMRIGLPVISDRDYFVDTTTVDELATTGRFATSWTLSAEQRPSRPGIVRVPKCEGAWELTREGGGKRTRVTFRTITDPGGMVPGIIADYVSTNAIPDLFDRVKAEVLKRQAEATARAEKDDRRAVGRAPAGGKR